MSVYDIAVFQAESKDVSCETEIHDGTITTTSTTTTSDAKTGRLLQKHTTFISIFLSANAMLKLEDLF